MQPPRGFGENPIAIYHDPDLPPSHHYLAAYRWLQTTFGAHALVHVGKHGNLEWLPGKTAALSASCAPDPILGNLPLVYPFLVNDPGEGTQAKRRAHATLVDHLVPPMARAESYGDLARLEQLLDEYASIQAMDPGKITAIRGQNLAADPGREARQRPRRLRPARGRALRRLRHAPRRLALRDQGRADPRRPARARPGAGRAGARRHGARDPARAAAVVGHELPARAARGAGHGRGRDHVARRHRPLRGDRALAGARDGEAGLGDRRRPGRHRRGAGDRERRPSPTS